MTSAAEQQALIEGPSGNPGLPSDDFSDEAFAPSKKQSLKLGFLKVRILSGEGQACLHA